MIKSICSDFLLRPFLRERIEDSGVEVEIDGKIKKDEIAIIKVDDYFANNSKLRSLKSVDFVVTVDCSCNSYALYVLELKNVNGPEKLVITDINAKFKNTVDHFLSEDYAAIFLNDSFKYKCIKFYLVSDAYKESGKFASHKDYLRFREKINKRDTLKVDLGLAEKLFHFKGKLIKIQYEIPSSEIIKKYN